MLDLGTSGRPELAWTAGRRASQGGGPGMEKLASSPLARGDYHGFR